MPTIPSFYPHESDSNPTTSARLSEMAVDKWEKNFSSRTNGIPQKGGLLLLIGGLMRMAAA